MEEERFFPPSEKWQKKLCTQFSIEHKLTPDLYQSKEEPLGTPTSFRQVQGDGNCLFRALAYAISGDEENQRNFRSLIVSHLPESESWVLQNETADKYLERTKMSEDKKWGTEVELYTAASLFRTRIFVYSKYGPYYKWLVFKPLNDKTIYTHDSIYLYHRSECHYDVVTTVSGRISRHESHSGVLVIPEDVSIQELDDSENSICGKSIVEELGVSLQDPLGTSIEKIDQTRHVSPSVNVNDQSGDLLGTSLIEQPDETATNIHCLPPDLPTSTIHSGSDLYSFNSDEENDLSYTAFKKKLSKSMSSTPRKKSKIIEKEADSSHNRLETSILNSSFKESLSKKSPRKPKKRQQHSRMLQKALDTVESCIRKGQNCKFLCLEEFDKSDITGLRESFWTKTFENRVEWFYDKMSEASKKQHQLFFTTLGGKKVCAQCFRLLLHMSRTFFFKYQRKFTQGRVSAGIRRARKIGKSRENAILWMDNYIYFHTEQMPDSPIRLLQYKYRKRMVYDAYIEEMMNRDEVSVSFSTFREIWKEEFPYLKIKQTNTFSMCSTCYTIEKEMEGTRNRQKREYLKKMMRVHNERQMRERRYYYSKREKAKNAPKKHMSLIIDAMDQSKTNIPHFTGRMQKGIDPTALLKTHIQGVINHGKGTYTYYVDINEYSHDANLVMNIILKSVYASTDKHGRLPEILYIQADNCARENKNKFVLAFCELLVKLRVFHEVHLSFLYVGHTHEDIDASFSVIAEKLRKEDAETLPQLQKILNGGRRVQGFYDIKNWIAPCINQIQHHSKPLHFKFQSTENYGASVYYRENCQRAWKNLTTNVLSSLPKGQPSILLPPNFNNINIDGLRSNVEKYKFQFSDKGAYNWWLKFINEIKETMESQAKLRMYAKKQAVWLLPLVKNKSRRYEEEMEEVNPVLMEALDRELDEHLVVVKETKSKKQQRVPRKS
ncbi:uncharacterized protein LOC134270664 [Saccostrea cucullata]|uniref:uncharacterized protein LOC134270664 n=1 Tax=Saccostrea cuccullata TaxID=36930 RepID=UPI002ED58E33